MLNIFKFKVRITLVLLVFGLSFQFAKAEFHFETQQQGGIPFMDGGSPGFTQGFIGYHFPQEPFTGCADYGKLTGFNANPILSPGDNPNGPVDKIIITAITDGAFENSLYTGSGGPITNISMKSYKGKIPIWQQEASFTNQMAVFQRIDVPEGTENYTQELYFTIRFALDATKRAFLYFDSYYKGIQKERYVIKWSPNSWEIYPVNICLPLPEPIANWTFDECIEGALAYDDIDPVADGEIHGATRIAGHNGKALKFEQNDYVYIGTQNKLNLHSNKSMTISAWVKAFDLNTMDMQILSKGWDGLSTQYELKTIIKGNKHHITFRSVTGGWTDDNSGIISNGYIDIGNWYHLVGVYDENSDGNMNNNSGLWKIYINGIKDSEVNHPGIYQTDRPVLIGAVATDVNGSDGNTQFWWDGIIDEVKIYDIALTDIEVYSLFYQESFGESKICDQNLTILDEGDLVLWYDANEINGLGEPSVNYQGDPVQKWVDKTFPNEDAIAPTENRIPTYNVSNIKGVKFGIDYTSNHYGYSDIMVAEANEELTTENPNQWQFPEEYKVSKNLLVVFKTGDNINRKNPPYNIEDPKPYYSDGRQTICEFGGPLSGFNIYISNGHLCFGMWNRFERRYTVLLASDLYPLTPEIEYLAHIEYDAPNSRFKIHFSNGVKTWQSNDWIEFSGLTWENDNVAIGGASRTSYHDFNTGETFSDHFSGIISEILLYNKDFDLFSAQAVYDYLALKYSSNYQFVYPEQLNKTNNQDWFDICYNDENNSNDNILSSAYPNPFTTKTSFSVNIKESQYVNIELLDATGNIVKNLYKGELAKGINNFDINNDQLSNGMYFYRIITNEKIESGKVILIK